MPRYNPVRDSPAKNPGEALAGIVIGIISMMGGIVLLFTQAFSWGVCLSSFGLSFFIWGYKCYGRFTQNSSESSSNVISIATNRNEYLTQGNSLMTQKRYAPAETAFMNAVQLEPQSAPAWFSLGEVAVLAGDTKTAVWAFQRGLSIAPGEKYARDSLAGLQ